jgi:CheY-like chemotaxis protein
MSTDTPSHLILVVDEDPDIRDVLWWGVDDAGYRSLVASDGHKASGLIEHDRPDLILLDINMPLLDVPAICQMYRGRGGRAQIVLVAVTSTPNIEAITTACGAAAYIRKPFEVIDLLVISPS